ncbi:MAG: LysR family transcriptional regulator [Rhodoferax sp.]|nr:LysR family transcriptional regulator [Rhodoferax sp.]
MKLSSLRDFVTVAERGSLRAAARQLEVSQPTITRSIQELEKDLGVALFERQAKGVHLTPMGEMFFRRSKAIRMEVTRAQDEIHQTRGALHGHITVCLSSAAHMALLPSAIRPFRQKYPEVSVRLMDSLLPGVERQLTDGTVDCYVGPAFEGVSGELSVEKLFENTRVVLGRKGHPLANATSFAELAQAEWMTASSTPRAQEDLLPLFAQHGLPAPKLVFEAQSALSFLTIMTASDLLMLLPIQWMQTPIFRDALQRINIVEPLRGPPICIVQRIGLPLTPAAEYFCDMIRRASLHVHTQVD